MEILSGALTAYTPIGYTSRRRAFKTQTTTKVIAETTDVILFPSGKFSLLVGLNGQGKSTLMKALCGVDGFLNNETIQPHASYLPEELDFGPELTFDEIAKSLLDEEGLSLATQLAEETKLHRGHYAELSKGNKQKLRLIMFEVLNDQRIRETNQPILACLDEPLSGLDYESRDFWWNFWHSERRTTKQMHRVIALHPTEIPYTPYQVIMVNSGLISLWNSPKNTIPTWANIKEGLSLMNHTFPEGTSHETEGLRPHQRMTFLKALIKQKEAQLVTLQDEAGTTEQQESLNAELDNLEKEENRLLMDKWLEDNETEESLANFQIEDDNTHPQTARKIFSLTWLEVCKAKTWLAWVGLLLAATLLSPLAAPFEEQSVLTASTRAQVAYDIVFLLALFYLPMQSSTFSNLQISRHLRPFWHGQGIGSSLYYHELLCVGFLQLLIGTTLMATLVGFFGPGTATGNSNEWTVTVLQSSVLLLLGAGPCLCIVTGLAQRINAAAATILGMGFNFVAFYGTYFVDQIRNNPADANIRALTEVFWSVLPHLDLADQSERLTFGWNPLDFPIFAEVAIYLAFWNIFTYAAGYLLFRKPQAN